MPTTDNEDQVVKRVLQALQELMDSMVKMAATAPPVLKEIEENAALMVAKVLQEDRDPLDHEVTEAIKELRDSLALMAETALTARTELLILLLTTNSIAEGAYVPKTPNGTLH